MAEAQEVVTDVNIKDKTANPTPLGFTGLGLAAVLLSLSYIGLYPVDSMVVSMAIFLGGFAQVFAGIMAWKKGVFLVARHSVHSGFSGSPLQDFYLCLHLAGLRALNHWHLQRISSSGGVYTFIMLIATLKLGSKAIMFIFVTLFLLFMLLAVINGTGNTGLLVIAGYVGLIMGLSALYTALGGSA